MRRASSLPLTTSRLRPRLLAHALDDFLAVARVAHGAGGHGSHPRFVPAAQRGVAPERGEQPVGGLVGILPVVKTPSPGRMGSRSWCSVSRAAIRVRTGQFQADGVGADVDGCEHGLKGGGGHGRAWTVSWPLTQREFAEVHLRESKALHGVYKPLAAHMQGREAVELKEVQVPGERSRFEMGFLWRLKPHRAHIVQGGLWSEGACGWSLPIVREL
jgi:hypothetical protein